MLDVNTYEEERFILLTTVSEVSVHWGREGTEEQDAAPRTCTQ